MKNKSLIINIGLIASSVLAIIFLATNFVARITGYEFFDSYKMLSYIDNFGHKLLYLAPLFILIGAIILLVSSVLALLVNVNVIKSEMLLKVVRIINIVASAIVAVFAIASLVIVIIEGGIPVGFGLIATLVLGAATLAGSILDLVWSRK